MFIKVWKVIKAVWKNGVLQARKEIEEQELNKAIVYWSEFLNFSTGDKNPVVFNKAENLTVEERAKRRELLKKLSAQIKKDKENKTFKFKVG